MLDSARAAAPLSAPAAAPKPGLIGWIV